MINATPTTSTYLKQPVTGLSDGGSMGSMGAMGGGGSVTGGSTGSAGSMSSAPLRRPSKSFFGFDLRSLATVAGLTLFIVGSMVGVTVALRQRLVRQTAPTAPDSKPAAFIEKTSSCTLTFNVGSVAGNHCAGVEAYQDTASNTPGNYSFNQNLRIANASAVTPGQQIVAYLRGNAPQRLDGSTIVWTVRLDANTEYVDGQTCFSYNAATRTATCTLTNVAASANIDRAIRVRISPTSTASSYAISANIRVDVSTDNQCAIAFVAVTPSPTPSPSVTPSPSPSVTPSPSPSVSPSPSPSVSPSPSPTYACNSSCSTDAQCQTANGQYICSNAHGNVCRLDSNRDSTTCEPKSQTYACNSSCSTDEQCRTANGAYVCSQNRCRLNSNVNADNCLPTTVVYPPPLVGCNDSCVTNADCKYSNHICYTTPSGANRCRLDTYPNSDTCSLPGTVYTYTPGYVATYVPGEPGPVYVPATKGGQPLPVELPKTGPEDWFKWAGAGLAVLGLGAVLLIAL